jgi:hypothetical protein
MTCTKTKQEKTQPNKKTKKILALALLLLQTVVVVDYYYCKAPSKCSAKCSAITC